MSHIRQKVAACVLVYGLFGTLHVARAQNAPVDSLVFTINARGDVTCTADIILMETKAWQGIIASTKDSHVPVYVMLPFDVRQPESIRAPEDLMFTFKRVEDKCSLLTFFVPKTKGKGFGFQVMQRIPTTQTVDGRLQLSIDYSYKDVSSAFDEMKNWQSSIYAYDVYINTPRDFVPTEVPSDKSAPFMEIPGEPRRLVCTKKQIMANNSSTWFAYPNLGDERERAFILVMTIIVGLATTPLQYFPAHKRMWRLLLAILFVGILAVIVMVVCYTTLARNNFMNVAIVAAPLIPHALAAIIAGFYIITTKNSLVKVEGKVYDDSNSPLRSAIVTLQESRIDRHNWKRRAELAELETDGRFLFTFVRSLKRKYRVLVEKAGFEEYLSHEFSGDNTPYEFEQPIKLVRAIT